jgi:hypothetical protein
VGARPRCAVSRQAPVREARLRDGGDGASSSGRPRGRAAAAARAARARGRRAREWRGRGGPRPAARPRRARRGGRGSGRRGRGDGAAPDPGRGRGASAGPSELRPARRSRRARDFLKPDDQELRGGTTNPRRTAPGLRDSIWNAGHDPSAGRSRPPPVARRDVTPFLPAHFELSGEKTDPTSRLESSDPVRPHSLVRQVKAANSLLGSRPPPRPNFRVGDRVHC